MFAIESRLLSKKGFKQSKELQTFRYHLAKFKLFLLHQEK